MLIFIFKEDLSSLFKGLNLVPAQARRKDVITSGCQTNATLASEGN